MCESGREDDLLLMRTVIRVCGFHRPHLSGLDAGRYQDFLNRTAILSELLRFSCLRFLLVPLCFSSVCVKVIDGSPTSTRRLPVYKVLMIGAEEVKALRIDCMTGVSLTHQKALHP